MFGNLPDLFDRNFAIGYFIPVAVFVLINGIFAVFFGIMPNIFDFKNMTQLDILVETTIFALISWFLSIILLSFNRELTRFLEGYGKLNPLRIFHKLELSAYDRFHQEKNKLDELFRDYKSKGDVFPNHLRAKRNQVSWEIKERFPTERREVLPTSFGNTIRAFERYSLEMYGIDAIPGWNRLIAVIPNEYKEHIDDAKVYVDFWMNTFYLNILLLIEFVILLIIFDNPGLWFLFFVFALTSIVSYSRTTKVATLWGDTIKSAFDVFLPLLWKKMGYAFPKGKDEKIKLWRRFNQAVIYGRPDLMPEIENLGQDELSNKQN